MNKRPFDLEEEDSECDDTISDDSEVESEFLEIEEIATQQLSELKELKEELRNLTALLRQSNASFMSLLQTQQLVLRG